MEIQACFISESLITTLKRKKLSMINLTTATVNQIQITHKVKVIYDLQINGITQSKFFYLNHTLSTNSILVGRDDIPTEENVDQFPELMNVYILSMDEEIG